MDASSLSSRNTLLLPSPRLLGQSHPRRHAHLDLRSTQHFAEHVEGIRIGPTHTGPGNTVPDPKQWVLLSGEIGEPLESNGEESNQISVLEEDDSEGHVEDGLKTKNLETGIS